MQEGHDLAVWHRAHQLALDVYRATKRFPPDEQCGLVHEMRRAAASLSIALAQAHRPTSHRQSPLPVSAARSVSSAERALQELRYYLTLSRDLGHLGGNLAQLLTRSADDVARMLQESISGPRPQGLGASRLGGLEEQSQVDEKVPTAALAAAGASGNPAG